MVSSPKSWVAVACVVALLASSVPTLAQDGTGRLEGTVLGLDGTPASGIEVVLIGENGAEISSATTDANGNYAIAAVPAGAYGLGLVLRNGTAVTVPGDDVVLVAGEVTRRDLQLVQAGTSTPKTAVEPPPVTAGKAELWWAGLSPVMKGVVIGGGVAAIALIAVAVSGGDDDDEESASSF